jgi:hypothetical protein
MNTEKELSNSNDMPEPQVVQYYQIYRITDMFVRDLKTILGDMAYADTKQFIDRIEECGRIMPIAKLDEFIKDLSGLPYKIVSKLMCVIEKKDNFLKYFEPIPLQKPEDSSKEHGIAKIQKNDNSVNA